MSRDSRQIRNFSLLSITRGSPKPSKSTDDLSASHDFQPQRPTSSARDSFRPRRLSIMGLRAQRSMHDLGATLKDSLPSSHNRLSSLNVNPAFLQDHEPSPPLPANARAVSGYFPDHEPPPNAIANGGPRSSSLFANDLMPPPPIGGSFAERSASPGGSRSSSKTRGRRDSYGAGDSPVDSRANSPSRPGTPGGKLGKKKTWSLGKSHGKRDSASAASQPWAFIVGTAGKQAYELSYLTKAQPVIALSRHQRNVN